MFEKPRLYPIRDIESPLRPLGNLFLGLGLCLLLLVGLRARSMAISQVAISVQGAAISPNDSLPERTISAASLVENAFEAIRRNSSGMKVEEGEPSPASPERSILEPRVEAEVNSAKRQDHVKSLAPPPTRLVIPALGIDAPIVEVPITNETWDVSGLTHEIAHLGGTANPGEKNNLVLAGHVTLTRGVGPFLHLESLEPGDLAIVYAGEQAYAYRVVSKRYVEPTDVSVTDRTSDPILTLITCSNWNAGNRTYVERVAVIAELVEEGAP